MGWTNAQTGRQTEKYFANILGRAPPPMELGFLMEKCGAIEGFARRTKFKIESSMSKGPAVQLLENRGDVIFIDDMTQRRLSPNKKLPS